MIIYSPLDGDVLASAVPSRPRQCFLMTKLGDDVPSGVEAIRTAVTRLCRNVGYGVIDAHAQVTGRDFLMKIWKLIASTPLSVGVCHEDIPPNTQMNIYYELGVAQALGKETLVVKSPGATQPSDFVRTEYVMFDGGFDAKFTKYMQSLREQAYHYELVADQLYENPVLAVDYLKRAFLISGEDHLRTKAKKFLRKKGFSGRARNSVEFITAGFC